MKKMKAFLTTLAVAALLVLLPGGSALKAEAAEAKNYAVKFVVSDNTWRFQEGSTFDETVPDREIYYLRNALKEGDKVAVYSDATPSEDLDLGSVKLGDVTICGTKMAVVRTGGATICNILPGSTCSVSGNIDTAHVYDVATVTFASNVTELIATASGTDLYSNIGCTGTVGHLYAYSTDQPRTFYTLYNFDANTLDIQNGNLQTPHYNYDATAPAATPTPTVTPAATATATPAATTQSSSSEYDDVPKTGDSRHVIFCLLGIGIVSCFGSIVLRKRASK